MAFRGMLCIVLLSITWTSTRAVSLGGNVDHAVSETREHRENLVTRLLINEIREEAMIGGHEDIAEDLIRRYLENEAARLARSGGAFRAKNRRSRRTNVKEEQQQQMPFSTKRFEKMLEKAIFKIITGDLSNADITLLKSLNYSLEDILAIRERELGKKLRGSEIPMALRSVHRHPEDTETDRETKEKDGHPALTESLVPSYGEIEDNKDHSATVSSVSSRKSNEKADDFDFDAYNRQAVLDYENAANKMSEQRELDPRSSVVDYDDQSRNVEPQAVDDDAHDNFNRAMESHVVFKIRYDDSEFDSTSDERARQLSKERRDSSRTTKKTPENRNNRNVIDRGESGGKSKGSLMLSKAASWTASKLSGINATSGLDGDETFQARSPVDLRPSMPVVYRLGNFVKPQAVIDESTTEIKGPKTSGGDAETRNKSESTRSENTLHDRSTSSSSRGIDSDDVQVYPAAKNESSDDFGRTNLYEGLEWVEDDVYRVIPQALDEFNYDSVDNDADNDTVEDDDGNANRTSDSNSMMYDDRNDTTSYQNEGPNENGQSQPTSSTKMPVNAAGLTTYQQLALAHRRDQGQKAIEDIKLRVLAITGRYNLSSSSNQVQRERLTMFTPTCQAPRNTDIETWSDPFSMNMYFQLNLTSGDHVVAAKMRIYKLPQIPATVPPGTSAVEGDESEDEEEKKIRISIYFYTKSLKKHRSKKRLMDSVVTSLTSHGSHLALDVRQALRFWRQNLRSSSHGTSGSSTNNSNNHGLVIQVEDQDGRPLKPSQYIQQGSCHTSEQNQDDKAYQRDPALFVQACSRYVRVVNGEAVTYVNCSKSLRNDRH